MKKIILFGILLLASLGTQAQTYVSAPMTGTPAAGSYYSNTQIILSPGFQFAAGAGSSLNLYIIGPNCFPLNTTPSSNQNYVMTSVPQVPAYNPANTGYAACDVMQSIQYFDGLGRLVQTVQVKGSATGNDVVQPAAYDAFGREDIKYLPYTAAGTAGSYRSDALAGTSGYSNSAQKNFHGLTGQNYTTNSYPYAQTVFEASPLNRVLNQGAPGASWQIGSGHTVTSTYGTNAATDVVKWVVAANGNGATGTTKYAAGTLTCTTATDENGHAVITYTDMQGKVVCKKVQSGASTYLSTCYVYNNFDNLAYVVPPIPAGTTYPTSFTEASAVFKNFMYGYHYDERNRMTEKKIPGKGWDYMVYNKLDKVVATQDSVLKGAKKWLFTKYDVQERVIITGVWNNGGTAITRAALQTAVNGNSTFWETTTAGGNGYTNLAWPVSNVTATLSLNYYDRYSGIPGLPAKYSAPAGASTNTRGLLTASKTAVLNNPTDMLLQVVYYDNKGRNLQTYKQHYLGGSIDSNKYDIIATTYNDFTSEVDAVTRKHYTTASTTVPQLTTVNSYEYDHTGKKIKSYQQINGGVQVLLSKTDYNEVGQVYTKNLHSTNGGSSFLQAVTYGYNPRGWLQRASAPLFAMQLKYDDGTVPQYNGNISNQYWGTAASPITNNYVYRYDYLNRLVSGIASTNNTEKSITYDNLGNITGMQRYLNNVKVDGLMFSYLNGSNATNQLRSITDSTASNLGLKAGTFSYTYDGNGNMLTDASKGTAGMTVTYNLLNLPQTNTLSGTTVTYTYDAAGRKLRKVSGSTVTEYIDGIQYTGTDIDFVQTEEGRALRSGSNYNYEYNLSDHLGNTRLSFDSSTGTASTRQQDDYLPFGLNVSVGTIVSPKNQYLYNNKELQEETGQYDYGARFYDPVIGRWTAVDPSSEEGDQESLTPYQYGINNPIRYDDPDGRCPTCLVGLFVGGGIDAALQSLDIALSDNKSFSKDFSWKSVGVSAIAGATGVGLASKIGKLGTVAKIGIELAHDALAGAANQYVTEGKVDAKKVVVGAIVGKAVGDVTSTQIANKAANSAEGKLLARQADRANRVAVGGRQSRKLAAEKANKKLEAHVQSKAVAAGVSSSGVAADVVNNAMDKKKEKDKQ